jgi:hypothetical protein
LSSSLHHSSPVVAVFSRFSYLQPLLCFG